jgi:hypothetical protein
MMPVFVYPLAFLGLLALPALVAIYWLRNRHRRRTVSSLLLWIDPRETRAGGSHIRRLQTPLLFFLEMAALLLLVLAAAGPYLHSSRGARPLVVVLDDSFSMRAGGDRSARSQALQAIEEEFERGHRSIRLILAGDRPTLLGEPARNAGELRRQLEQWHCQATSACLDEALALASELGGELALLLVATDQQPARSFAKGRVEWRAFGEPRDNLAIVNAARTNRAGVERCLVEVANLSAQSRSTTLVITDDAGHELQRSRLSLDPQAAHRTIFQLKLGSRALHARLDEELAIDNRVDLLPAGTRQVGMDIRISDAALRPLVEKAVQATRGFAPRAADPDLVVTDAADLSDIEPAAWVLQVLAEKDAEAFVGPFILDRGHPLTEGLSLQGVIWGAGKEGSLEGAPVIMAGNVPLLADAEGLAGRHIVRLRLQPDLSKLQDSPNWPILVDNLVQWRALALPGLSRVNLRPGEETVLTLDSAAERVQLRTPDGKERSLPVQNRRVVVRAEQVGVHELRAGKDVYRFAVNALSREESDLTRCASGRWGDWLDDTSLRLEYRSVGWVLLLLVLGVLSLHGALVGRQGRHSRGPAAPAP